VRPSRAISAVAIFVALGGTGYAAAKVGSAEIKNNSVRGKDVRNSNLTGKDVKRNSLTGSDIAESRLGKVRSAIRADSAGTAGAAGGLGGAASAGLLSTGKTTTSGLVKLPTVGTSPATSPERVLLRQGPFTIGVRCYATGANPTFRLSLRSSEPGSVINEDQLNEATATVSSGPFYSDTVFVTLQAPSGAALGAQVTTTLNALGADCSFSVDGLRN
jgi:hypothetical protein